MTTAEVAKLREDLAAFGASEAAIATAVAQIEAEAPAAPPAFRVHPDNVVAVRLFAAMATQWNMVALATLDRAEVRRVGLRYEVLDRVARGLGVTEGPGDFDRLQLMEAKALEAWAEERRQ